MKRLIIFLLILCVPASAWGQSSLKKAYQREVAYLRSQKHTLQKRVDSMDKVGKKNTASAQAKINQLQKKWLYLQAESERLQNALSDANVKGPSTEDQNDALLGTYEQGRQSLLGIHFSIDEKEKVGAKDFENLFAKGISAIAEGREVRTKKGTYFDKDGVSKEGSITKIGRIAAYAEGLPLAPVGEGNFKVWPQVGKEKIGVVLFESVEKAMTPPEEKSLMDTIQAGGTIAYIIVLLGIFAALLLLVRAFFLFGFSSKKGFASSLKAELKSMEKAKSFAKKERGLVAKAATKMLERRNPNVEDIDEIIGGLAPSIERFGTIIMVIAAIAPLLGLLGTVTGMIATFDIITEYGTGDPKLLSSGISEALITTKFGLVVAIPTLVFGNIFRAWGDKIIDEIEHVCLIILGADGSTPQTPREVPHPQPVFTTVSSPEAPLLKEMV